MDVVIPAVSERANRREGFMSRKMKAVTASILSTFLVAPNAQAVTLSEAQNLSVPALASLVLGEVGRLYNDVLRPTGYEHYSISIPRNAPRRLTVLSFYGPASLASSRGLCSAHELTVYFDNAGSPKGFHDSIDYKYADEGIASTPSDQRALYILRRNEEKSCASIASTKNFFSAAGGPDYADRAAAAIVFAINSYNLGRKVPGDVECRGFCGQGDLYSRISLNAINQIDFVDCKTKKFTGVSFPVPDHACFQITLNDQPFSSDLIFLETNKTESEVRATSLSALMGRQKVY